MVFIISSMCEESKLLSLSAASGSLSSRETILVCLMSSSCAFQNMMIFVSMESYMVT